MADVEVRPTLVRIDDLRPDPENPRRIDEKQMERLMRSITDDPAFMVMRPILCREDGTIYAGNMRWQACKKLGWEQVPAIITHDPEAIVRKRAVQDNTQFGEWNDEELGEYLSLLDDSVDLTTLGLDDTLIRTLGMEQAFELAELRYDAGPDAEPGTFVGGMERPFPPEADAHINALEDADPELKGALKLNEDKVYRGDDVEPTYETPLLRDDRLVQELPEGMETWAGGDAGQDAPFYLYNYSPHKTTQNAPLDRSMLAFFTDDRFFLPWSHAPAYYVGKMLNAGVRIAVEPDFSVDDLMPKLINLIALYRCRWLARFMQDAGIAILPRIPYPAEKPYMLAGFPVEAPVIALNCQTSGVGTSKDEKEAHFDALFRDMSAVLELGARPRQVLLYGQVGGERIRDRVKWPDGCEPVVLNNFLAERRARGLPYRES